MQSQLPESEQARPRNTRRLFANVKHTRWVWVGLSVLVIIAIAAAAFARQPQPATAQTPANIGLVCTTGANPNPTFTLATQTGYIQLPDGNTMFMWGYSVSGQPFQHPGPVLCVNQGDTVTVILQNNLPEAVSVAFPGQENVLANGAPVQPEFNGATLTSLTNTAAPGGSITYQFVASNPGTFIYESGTNPRKQVGMGLFGALIVHPTLGADFAYNRADSEFTQGEEFLMLLSEIDPYQHQAVETGAPYNINNYKPRYWLINGRGFPDTIADNFAPWLPAQPYGALARIHPWNNAVPANDLNYHPYPGLVRYINVGTEDYPFHPHGNNGAVVGRDGQALESSSGQDLSFEKFAINIGPGQTWDVLFQWHDAEGYNSATNPVPVTVPAPSQLAYGQYYSGSPYLGEMGPLNPGANTLNMCGEYYIIAHNHALYQITAWGVTMASQITYVRVDPPLPNTCP